MKDALTYFGGIVALGNLSWYALEIWVKKIPPTSYTSWLMWLILDVLVVLTTYAAGKPIWLPLGWTIGTAAITLVLFVRGSWAWTIGDTICAIGAVISAIIWMTTGATYGIIAEVASLVVAGGPLIMATVKKPDAKGIPLWAVNAEACIFTALGSDWTIGGVLVAATSFTYSIVIISLILRGHQI